MTKISLFLILFLLASCTEAKKSSVKAESPSLVTATTTLNEEQKMPQVQIEQSDRSCVKDSDCVLVATKCSCSCAAGVNKNKAEKYEREITKLCKDYHGIMCKVLCNGSVKCKDKLCDYVE